MTNPFKFGKAVSGDEFYDRKDSFRKLYTKLSGGSCNVVLYAPRRYGKTSLVKKVDAPIAARIVREFDADYRRKYSLGASSTVHASLKALVDAGLVESDEGLYCLGDPFFARYIRSRPW